MGQVISGSRVIPPEAVPLPVVPTHVIPYGTSPFRNNAYGAQFVGTPAGLAPYHYAFGPSMQLPPQADIRERTAVPYPPILDQKSLGACTAFATVGAIECSSRRASLHPLWALSPLYNYVAALRAQEPAPTEPLEDTGTTVLATMRSALTTGIAARAAWSPGDAEWNKLPGPEIPHPYRATQLGHLPQNLVQFRTAIAAGFAIAFSFAVTDAGNAWMKSPGRQQPSFIYPVEREISDLNNVVGAHAVVLVGYDDLAEVFTVRNSWGAEWGDHGHFYMAYSMVVQPFWCRDFFVVLGVGA